MDSEAKIDFEDKIVDAVLNLLSGLKSEVRRTHHMDEEPLISHPSSFGRNGGKESDEESDEEPGEEPKEEPIEEWIDGVRKNVDSAQPMDHREGPCTIFKVPKHIRRLDPEAYKPMFAYLGPFHHNSRGSSLMKYYKWRCVQHLLSRHRSRECASQLLNECLLELKKQDEKVRSCYSKNFSKLNAQAMALIMLLDGCFIIYLMLKMCLRKESSIKKERKTKKGIAKEIEEEEVGELEGEATEEDEGEKRRESVIERREGEVVLNIEEKDKKGKGIAKEIEEEEVGKLESEAIEEDESKKRRECMIEPREGEVVLNIDKKDEQLEGPTMAGLFTIDVVIYDLLKLENQIPFFIIQLLFDLLKPCEDGQINLVDLALQLFKGIHPEESESFKKSKKKSPGEYHHLLHLFYSSRIPSEKPAESTSALEEAAPSQGASTFAPTSRGSPTSAPKWIPIATELDRAGVKFKRKEQADTFLNITVQTRKMKLRGGWMEIPPLQIYDYTRPLFQNLIAFEQCYSDTKMYITIYALFMNSIIDQAEDVRLLHLKGILEQKIGQDREVADLFNKLGRQVSYILEKNYLANQIEEVNNFYKANWRNRLDAFRRFFKNPWIVIAVWAMVYFALPLKKWIWGVSG